VGLDRLPIYFLGGIQLLCIGIIGEYLAKIYMETKGRPATSMKRPSEPQSAPRDGTP
jgi:hypothetical protein